MNNTGYDIQNENYDDIHAGHVDFMEACAAFPAPDILDPRTWYPIEMQWNMSSCVGHAETGPLEVSYRNATGKVGLFSRMYAYLKAQQYSDIIQPGCRYFGRDGGALIAGARRAACEAGCCMESTMPYPKPVQYSTKITDTANKEAATFKMQSSSVIKATGGGGDAFDQIKAYLGAGVGGILFGAPWPIQLNSSSTLTQFRNYGSEGHAQCIIGYLKDLLVCANSHSTSYGDKGFWYMTRQGANEFIANRAVTAVGLSDLSVPRGRKVDWTTESMFA